MLNKKMLNFDRINIGKRRLYFSKETLDINDY